MIWAPYFERNTIISTTCVVRYAYICADVAIIEDYCYARCLPVSPAAPYYRWSQHNPRVLEHGHGVYRAQLRKVAAPCKQPCALASLPSSRTKMS